MKFLAPNFMEIGTLPFWIGSIRYRHIRHQALLGKQFPIENFTHMKAIDNWEGVPVTVNNLPVIFVEDSSAPDTDSSLSEDTDSDTEKPESEPDSEPVIKKTRVTGKPANFVALFAPHGFERAHSPKWFSGSVPKPKSKACVNRCCNLCICIDKIRDKRS